MNDIEQLIQKACKLKYICLSDILDLNLADEDYRLLREILESKNIEIIEGSINTCKNKSVEVDFNSDSLRQYINEITAIPLLSEEEEKRLFIEYNQTHDNKIREKLICANLRLVVKIASEYRWRLRNNSSEYLDLIQEGNKGLIKAIEKFDVTLGKRFGAYAPWWIRQSIGFALNNMVALVRLPDNIITTYWKIQKQKNEVKKNEGNVISELEAARILGIKDKRAQDVINKGNLFFESIDECVSDNSRETKAEYMESLAPSVEEMIIDKLLFEDIMKIMKSKLNPREFFIVCCRNGIINDIDENLSSGKFEDMGRLLGISRQRSQQILMEAYRKIKEEYQLSIQNKKIRN